MLWETSVWNWIFVSGVSSHTVLSRLDGAEESTDNVPPPSSLLVYNILSFCLDQRVEALHASSVNPKEWPSGGHQCHTGLSWEMFLAAESSGGKIRLWWKMSARLLNDSLITKTEVWKQQRVRTWVGNKMWLSVVPFLCNTKCWKL